MTNTRRVAEDRHALLALSAVSLTEVEAATYAGLVHNPRATSEEIAEIVDATVAEVRTALSTLVSRGLATRVAGTARAYQAVPPDIGLARLITEKESTLSEARGVLVELTQAHRRARSYTHPAQLVEVVTGRTNIGERVGQVQSAARREIRGFDTPPYVAAPPHNLEPQAARLAAGISYRVVYDREAAAWPEYLETMILPLRRLGERSRLASSVPMKMFIADDNVAVIPMSSARRLVDAAYIVHPSSLLDALIELFELSWAGAKEVQDPNAAAPDVPDEHTGMLLTLLAAGHTDAGISRALGWSERTTQRRTRALMDELNVTTRFQAGVAARDRGWL